jgi:hypothetical protein
VVAATLFLYLSNYFYLPALRVEEGGRSAPCGTVAWGFNSFAVAIVNTFVDQVTRVKKCLCKFYKKQNLLLKHFFLQETQLSLETE